MKSRAISLILLLGLFTGIFASCSKGSTDEKNLNLSVNFDGMVFKADTINTAIKGNEIAVYTRDYRDNTGSYQLRIGGSHTDRASSIQTPWSSVLNTRSFLWIPQQTINQTHPYL